MNLKQFLSSSLRNQWIREPGIDLYVRRSIRMGIDIDLASLSADKLGNGAFTSFLDKYEPYHVFYVECIHNPRLVPYLAKRGYTLVSAQEGDVNMRGPAILY